MKSVANVSKKLWLLQSLSPLADDDVGDWQPSVGSTLAPRVDEKVPDDSDFIYLDT
jgi:hypothetical protein